jgi:hypothetical protein
VAKEDIDLRQRIGGQLPAWRLCLTSRQHHAAHRLGNLLQERSHDIFEGAPGHLIVCGERQTAWSQVVQFSKRRRRIEGGGVKSKLAK